MRAFVQASVKSSGYYWVTAEDNAEVEDVYPNYGFRDCMSLVDAALPALVIAAVPSEENQDGHQLSLLVLGLRERGENAYVNIPPTSLFLIFEPEEEAKLRALAVALLSPVADKVERHYFHNDRVSERLNACVSKSFKLVPSDGREMREDFFTVSPDFFSVVERIIEENSKVVRRKERAESVTDQGLAAKTSLPNQLALAAWLSENSLRLDAAPGKARPLVVVTANKLPDKIVAAGAWRVMSNLAESETWDTVHTSRAERAAPASATSWVKKAKPSQPPPAPPRVSQPAAGQEFEDAAGPEGESRPADSAPSKSTAQPPPAEPEVPTITEWGKQLVRLMSLLPSVVSNSVRGQPKKPQTKV